MSILAAVLNGAVITAPRGEYFGLVLRDGSEVIARRIERVSFDVLHCLSDRRGEQSFDLRVDFVVTLIPCCEPASMSIRGFRFLEANNNKETEMRLTKSQRRMKKLKSKSRRELPEEVSAFVRAGKVCRQIVPRVYDDDSNRCCAPIHLLAIKYAPARAKLVCGTLVINDRGPDPFLAAHCWIELDGKIYDFADTDYSAMLDAPKAKREYLKRDRFLREFRPSPLTQQTLSFCDGVMKQHEVGLIDFSEEKTTQLKSLVDAALRGAAIVFGA